MNRRFALRRTGAPVRRCLQPLLLALLLSATGLAGAAVPAGDSALGQEIYQRCLACHALSYNRVGPRHCGLLGREAGTVDGFDYSAAMRQSGLTWDESTLDAFLAAPLEVVPGTTMAYAGLDDAAERRHLIAYLKAVANDPESCPRS